jgi:hypothetical protein
MTPTLNEIGWALEIVRGKDVGRRYALGGTDLTLGNALGSESGIDLGDQEGEGPRRMAAQQAKLEYRNHEVFVRDLDSPGGTFVNRQRILPGQARALGLGDVIQIGGVQLRLVAGSASAPVAQAAPSAAPGRVSTGRPAAFQFQLRAGPVCRSWEDFLAVSAQRWNDLREELTSGRLAAFLANVGRTDLAPDPTAKGTPDERLDLWIGRLPTTRPAQPELEVQPATLVVRAAAGGGVVRRKLTINNTGYRLLRATARVEPASALWLRIAPEAAGKPLIAIDELELPLEITLPESNGQTHIGTIIVESNGGSRRIGVTVEPPVGGDVLPAGSPPKPTAVDWGLRQRIAGQSAAARLVGWAALAMVIRLLVGLTGAIGDSVQTVALAGPGLIFALVGGVLGFVLALHRGERPDMVPCALAGAITGLIAACVTVAACRAIEPLLGAALAGSLLAMVVLWGVLGVAAAGVSLALVPFRADKKAGATA